MRFYSSLLAPPVGLDWGSRWGKLVHLRRFRQTFALDRVARFCWQSQSAEEKNALLQAVWSHLGLRKKSVFLALGATTSLSSSSGNSGLEHTVFKPRQAGRFLMGQSTAYTAGTVLHGNKGSPCHVRIAASREAVDEACRQIQQAGLVARVVDSKALALCNIYTFAYAEQLARPVYLLHLGQTQSLILFCQDGLPVWLESLSLAGDLLTSFFADSSSLDAETGATVFSGSASENILENEMEKIVAMLRAKPQHADIVYLSGGCALFPALSDYLRSKLSLDVQILNCWRGFHLDSALFDLRYLEETAPQFAVACGMALRAAYRPKAGEQP